MVTNQLRICMDKMILCFLLPGPAPSLPLSPPFLNWASVSCTASVFKWCKVQALMVCCIFCPFELAVPLCLSPKCQSRTDLLHMSPQWRTGVVGPSATLSGSLHHGVRSSQDRCSMSASVEEEVVRRKKQISTPAQSSPNPTDLFSKRLNNVW